MNTQGNGAREACGGRRWQPIWAGIATRGALTLGAAAWAFAAVGAAAATFTPVTGVTGGAVSLIAVDRNVASATNATVAVVVQGVGLYTGTPGAAANGSTVAWSAQNCNACAGARSAA